jgi:lipopolysaccharide transport system ATP-binding protein
MNPAIKIENLSKQYRLGLVGTGTLSHDLKRWWHLVRGKEDPYLKVGEANDRSKKGMSEYIWALKDINLEVMPGEVLGIIGKNGAGKSTLLKILSKVTGPSTGTITYKGRIGSLLEVGTGFHQELTGRENIYLNGAILGMRKKEISRKFDEIVDFSGVERYIDTPVKRYSSGMTVRLGFAVAAFLEPEILVVDEVLAVGDAEFQKKAIGKMQDVSRNEGRTVLFVSHNMGAVKNLCEKTIVLKNGNISYIGKTNDGIEFYQSNNLKNDKTEIIDRINWISQDINISKITINGNSLCNIILPHNENELNFTIEGTLRSKRKMSLAVCLYDKNENRITTYDPAFINSKTPEIDEGQFIINERIKLPLFLNKGEYSIDIFILQPNVEYLMKAEHSIDLNINGFIVANGTTANSKDTGFFFLETALE